QVDWWGRSSSSSQFLVGVADREVVVVEDVFHQVGAARAGPPEGTAPAEAGEQPGLGVGEAQQPLGGGGLVGGLAEHGSGLGVGQETGGDLAGGGAVIGLGGEIGDA